VSQLPLIEPNYISGNMGFFGAGGMPPELFSRRESSSLMKELLKESVPT